MYFKLRGFKKGFGEGNLSKINRGTQEHKTETLPSDKHAVDAVC